MEFSFNLPPAVAKYLNKSKLSFDLPKIGSNKVVIDWGSSALKIASASKLKESYLVTGVVYQPVADNFSEVISQIWQTRKFSLSHIVLSLDGASTLVRVVDFPQMDKKTMRASLGYELSRYIPFSQDDVYFDFSVLDIEASAGNIKLLIAAAKKSFVDEKLTILEEAGIIPSQITLSPISLANAFLKFFPSADAPVGILDLGFSYSMITIIYKNNVYLSREVKKGANDILSKLSAELGKEIKNFKDLDDKQKDTIQELFSEAASDLVEEIRLSLDYLETKENLSVKKLYTTGGFTSCPSLSQTLATALGVEILPFNILQFFSYASSVKKGLEEQEGNFSVAISSLL